MRFLARWPFTLLLALVTIMLSVIGYYGMLSRDYRPNVLDWLPFTMAMFKMSWQWSLAQPLPWPDPPWPLHVARITGAVFTLLALSKVWMAFFGQQMKQWRLSRWHGHVVVCGLGRKGLQLAMEFRKRGKKVVITDLHPEEDDLQVCGQRGILVETGDAAKEVTLGAVGVERARYVMAVCREDHTNLEVAMEALARYTAAGRKDALGCYVHLVNLPLRVILQRHELFKTRPDRFDLRFFNVYENTARALFANVPPDQSVTKAGERVHLVIVGITRLGEAMATQAARICHYRDLRPVRLTLIDEQAEARGEQFLSRQPGLMEVSELRLLTMRLTEPRFTKLGFLEEGAAERVTVILCLEHDEANVGLALTLAEHTGGKIPLLANVSERQGLAKLLAASVEEVMRKGIHTFGAVEKVCDWDLLGGEKLDIMAKAFAQDYKERHGGADWPHLSEDLRNSNRAAADHVDVKLRAIGCRRVPARDVASPFAFTSDELETLSKMEHARWCADRRLSGWIYGPERDDQRKIHDKLAPWEELTEDAREKDRDQVRLIPAVLQQIGQAISRK